MASVQSVGVEQWTVAGKACYDIEESSGCLEGISIGGPTYVCTARMSAD